MTGFPGPVIVGRKGFVGTPGKGGSPETKREKGNRRPQGMIGPQGMQGLPGPMVSPLASDDCLLNQIKTHPANMFLQV